MFRPTAVIISKAVQNILIYRFTAVMTSGMSVVCVWAEWLRELQTWVWCNEVYGVHNVLSVHTVHNVHTVHSLRTAQTMHKLHTVHTVNAAHTLL